MRTCYNALQFYLQANQDYFPWLRETKSDDPPRFGLQPWEILHIYIQNTTPAVSVTPVPNPSWKPDALNYQVEWYFCPEDEVHHLTGQLWRTLPSGDERKVQYQLSYCAASEVMGIRKWEPVLGKIYKTRKSQSIQGPGRMVVFSEEGDDAVYGAENWELRDRNNKNDWNLKYPPSNQIGFELRHLSGQNIVYLDGHLQFHKMLDGQKDSWGKTQLGLPHFPLAFIPNPDPASDPEYKLWRNWQGRQITP